MAVVLLLNFSSTFSAQAQITFERYYDFGFTEEGYDVVESSDGGYVICGQQRLTIGESQIVLLKVDSLGNQQWVKFYGGPAENKVVAITRTFDNGYLIAGHTSSLYYAFYPYLIRTDSIGDTLWTTTKLSPIPILNPGDYGNGGCTDVIEARDSSIYILSQVADYDTATVFFLCKLQLGGDTIWTSKFKWNFLGPDLYRLSEDLDGNILLPGRIHYSLQPTFTCGASLIKTDTTGDTLWVRQYPFYTNNSGFTSVVQTSDSGYFLTGVTYWGAGNTNCYFVRTNAFGDTLWTLDYGGPANDGGWGILSSGNGYLLAGNTFSFGVGSSDVFMLKLDTGGNVQWQRTFGGQNFDNGNSVLQTTDGGYIICGFETSFGNGNGNIYLIKTDSTGYAPTGLNPLAPKKDRLSVYPNPNDGEFTVEYAVQENGVLQILNIYGVPVYEYEIPEYANSITIQKNLPAGLYFCKVTVGGALVGCEKIIVK